MSMLRAVCSLATISLLLVSAPSSAQILSDSEARRAILDLRARVDEMQQGMLKRVDDLSARIERLEQTTRGQLELQNQIQSMRQELASLRGAIEVQNNELAQAQKSQKDFANQIDNRVKRFEPVAVTIDGKPATVDVTERKAYDSALAVFRSGDFRAAQTSFSQFVLAYPQSAYGPAAQYWIGSSQYAQKDNKGAIASLQSFVQKYPDNPRVPEALLVVGTALAETGDRKGAADTFKALNQQFPEAPAAATARERLAALAPAPTTGTKR